MNTCHKEESPIKERRSSYRVPVDTWVEETTDRELYFQQGANISTGGLFLKSSIPHKIGIIVTLQFTLPEDTQPIRVKSEIVNTGRSKSELGMGVKFLNLTEEDRERVARFVARSSQKKSDG